MKLKTHDDRLTLTNGSYHALVHARKPKGIENKSAYLIGTGIGALAAGCFLIRDAHMDGSKITFFEQLDLPGLFRWRSTSKSRICSSWWT